MLKTRAGDIIGDVSGHKDTPAQRDDKLDTLVGAKQIAAYAGLDLRQVFRLLELGLLPGKKIGKLWISSQAAIRRALDVEAA